QPKAAAEESSQVRRVSVESGTAAIVAWGRALHAMLKKSPRFPDRRDGRVVEGARLESVYRGNSIQGSNPCLSARYELHWQAQAGFVSCDAQFRLPFLMPHRASIKQ